MAPLRRLIKCKHFDSNGKVITPCTRKECDFVHPSDRKNWEIAAEPASHLRDQVFNDRWREGQVGRREGSRDRDGDRGRSSDRGRGRGSSPRDRRSYSPPRSSPRRTGHRGPRSRSRSPLRPKGRGRSRSRSIGIRRSPSPKRPSSRLSERRSSPVRRSTQNSAFGSPEPSGSQGQKRNRVESDSSDALEKLVTHNKRPRLEDNASSIPTGPKKWTHPSNVPNGPAALRDKPTPPQGPAPPLPNGAAPPPEASSASQIPIPFPHIEPIKIPTQVPPSVVEALSRLNPNSLQSSFQAPRDPRLRDLVASVSTPPTPASASSMEISQPTPMKPSAQWKGYANPPSVGGTPVPAAAPFSTTQSVSTPLDTSVSGEQREKPTQAGGQAPPPLPHPAVASLQKASSASKLNSPKSPSVDLMSSSQKTLPESSAFPFPPSAPAQVHDSPEAMKGDVPHSALPTPTNTAATNALRSRTFPPAVVGSIIPEFRRTWAEIEEVRISPPPTTAVIDTLRPLEKRRLLSKELVYSTEARRLVAESQKQVSRMQGMMRIYKEAISDPLTSNRATPIEKELSTAKQRAADAQKLSDLHAKAVQQLMDGMFRSIAEEVDISGPIREVKQDSKKAFDSLETRLQRQEQTMNDLLTDLGTVKSEAAQLQETIKAQGKELREAQKAMKEHADDNKRLKDALADSSRKLAEQEDKRVSESAAMSLKITALQDRMATLETLLSDKESTWDDGADRATQLAAEIAELTNRLVEAESSLQTGTEAANLMQTAVNEAKDKVSLVEMQHEELRTYTHSLPKAPTIESLFLPLQERLIPAVERAVRAKLEDTLAKANKFTSDKVLALFGSLQSSLQLLDRGTRMLEASQATYMAGTSQATG